VPYGRSRLRSPGELSLRGLSDPDRPLILPSRDANTRETKFVYDQLDRLIEVDALAPDPDEITKFTYDAAGNLRVVTDPNDHDTTYAYSALSRLESVTQELGQQVQYRYDGRGRLARVVNARGHALDYAYEAWGPLAAVYHYDTEAAADADPGHAAALRTVAYAYDLAGNLTSTSDSDVQAGPLYTADPDTGYDALNRLVDLRLHYLPDAVERQLTTAYDRFGHRKSLALVKDPNGDVPPENWTV
jgi:YD repeat-containing protein